jgi:hypothetical protein
MITNPGVITFPVLFEAKPNLSDKLKYSCSFLIDKTDKEGIARLKAEIANAIERGKDKHWSGKVPKFNYTPLRDGDAELKDGTKDSPEYKGRFFLNAACNGDPGDDKPGVVGPDAMPLMDPSEIYSGCIVRLDIRAFPYKNGGNNGVGWWLNNVMKVDDGPRLDGKMNAVDAFAQYATESGELTGEVTTGTDDELA